METKSFHNILITGASGLIGTRLTELLRQHGHSVSHLSRHAKNNDSIKTFAWDIQSKKIDTNAFKNIDTIIHLAGVGIADKRWTAERKNEILESRIASTRLLFDALYQQQHAVKTFISASAIGYYGFQDNDKLFKETDKPGNDFLADVVKRWEDEVDKIAALDIRVVKMRVGIVLSEKGGALKEMAKPVKLFAGAPIGTGKQNLSWIHLDDLCGMFVMAVENNALQGAYNAAGPSAVTNEELTRAIAKVLNKPLILPHVPAFALKLVFGEMANLVLWGNKVSSDKIQQAGFRFRFKDLSSALTDLLK